MEAERTGGPPIGTRPDLSPDWAFVVHFRPSTLVEGGAVGGRVEHVASGRTGYFQSLSELAAFVREVLSGPPRGVESSTAEGGER